MPATRKISKEAQSQDLDQLKSLFSSSTSSGKTGKQIETVAPSEVQKTEEVQKSPQIETVASSSEENTKHTSDTTVGIRMTTQKKREMKAYFIQKGTTLSQGILDSYNLLKELESEGVVTFKDGQIVRNK